MTDGTDTFVSAACPFSYMNGVAVSVHIRILSLNLTNAHEGEFFFSQAGVRDSGCCQRFTPLLLSLFKTAFPGLFLAEALTILLPSK